MALINGDFETGDLTGWTVTSWGTAGTIGTVNVASRHSGNYGLYAAAWSHTPGVKGRRFLQNTDLTNISKVAFWIKIIDFHLDGGTAQVRVVVDGSVKQSISGLMGWTYYEVDISGYIGLHNLYFDVGAQNIDPLIELYLDDIELIIAPAPTISGNVQNSNGINLPSVAISLEDGTDYSTTTDANGDYSQAVDPDIYDVVASIPGNPDQSALVDASVSDQTQNFVFPVTTAPHDKGIRLIERYLVE